MDRLPEIDDRIARVQALQQRIGERYAITVPIEWAPPREGRFRPKPKPEQVTTSDWSLTGLGFIAPTRDDVRAPFPIIVTIGPVSGQALITGIRPSDEEGMSQFGVEFRDAALEDIARDLIGIHLDRVPSDRKSRGSKGESPEPYRPDFGDWS